MTPPLASPDETSRGQGIGPRWRATLAAILLVAAFLRLYRLGHSPPGFHVDEAGSAWNAYCLLKTGHDSAGVRWPIFYTRCFGDNRSVLMSYAMLPFQAVLGLSVTASRLPGAVAGVVAVFLIFLVGRRLFGAWTGLAAAAALALSPWHIQHSRWGHDSTLCPILVLAPLAALLWSGLPLSDRETSDRPWRAGLAGALSGLACLGYPAVRIFLPLFLLGALAVTWGGWRETVRRRRGILAAGSAALGLGLTLGPLLLKHLTDPAIGKRGSTTWVWAPEDGLVARIGGALARYPEHFSLDFLFLRGTPWIDVSPPPGYGLFHWYELPLLLAGLAAAVFNARTSRGARLILLGVALYPAGDLLNRHESMQVMRCLPGLPLLVLVEGYGAVQVARRAASRWRRSARLWLAGATTAVVLLSSGRFLAAFFGSDDTRWEKYFAFQMDLREAGAWLSPRFEQVDAVVCTATGIVHPYIHLLVSLRYDPRRWFVDRPTLVPGPFPDGDYKNEETVTRLGKIDFLFAGLPVPPVIREREGHGGPRRVVYIVRPGELGLEARHRPVYEVRSPRGDPVLWIFDVRQ